MMFKSMYIISVWLVLPFLALKKVKLGLSWLWKRRFFAVLLLTHLDLLSNHSLIEFSLRLLHEEEVIYLLSIQLLLILYTQSQDFYSSQNRLFIPPKGCQFRYYWDYHQTSKTDLQSYHSENYDRWVEIVWFYRLDRKTVLVLLF